MEQNKNIQNTFYKKKKKNIITAYLLWLFLSLPSVVSLLLPLPVAVFLLQQWPSVVLPPPQLLDVTAPIKIINISILVI